ncbi:MAG: M20 family metallo-hydrolase [Isosphaerales bacterium]
MTVFRPEVDIDRVMAELGALASKSGAPAPAVTRVVYTETDLAARGLVKHLFAKAGLSVREDPIGNTFARWQGRRPDISPVGTGSHIDAIPHSGRFDGTVGVLGALEAVRALERAGFRPSRPIEVLMFTSEEPTRFGIGCLGSRALCGALTAESLAALRDVEGHSFDAVRRAAGFHGELQNVRLHDGYFAAFVELHIEQGPLLERARADIGIVTAIAAPAALRVTWEGEGGHAGAVLMPERRDALCAAAETVLAVEAAACSSGSPDTVATTGGCRVHPGAINSIPDRVTLEIDVRDIDIDPRDRVVDEIRRAVDEIAGRRQVRRVIESLNADPPARMAGAVVEAIQDACDELGLASLPITSRAYHDSLFMARIAPTGMIFIPCKGGISHRPDESSAPAEIARGIEVLAGTLARLAGSEDHPRGSRDHAR